MDKSRELHETLKYSLTINELCIIINLQINKTLIRGDEMTEMGRRIRQIREQKGMTCTALAEQVGISAQGMWNLESGNNGRTLDKLPKIAKALGCRIDDLFPEMDDVQGAGEDKPVSADGFEDDSLDRLTM